MRDFVADCELRVQRLIDHPDDRLLLELFDREATYKNLVMHHDLRERNALYPFVAGKVAAEELQEILAQLRWPGS